MIALTYTYRFEEVVKIFAEAWIAFAIGFVLMGIATAIFTAIAVAWSEHKNESH
jgi:uncharacterized membrane protein YczE